MQNGHNPQSCAAAVTRGDVRRLDPDTSGEKKKKKKRHCKGSWHSRLTSTRLICVKTCFEGEHFCLDHLNWQLFFSGLRWTVLRLTKHVTLQAGLWHGQAQHEDVPRSTFLRPVELERAMCLVCIYVKENKSTRFRRGCWESLKATPDTLTAWAWSEVSQSQLFSFRPVDLLKLECPTRRY